MTNTPIPAADLMLLLRGRFDEQSNVPVVIFQGKEPLFVHFDGVLEDRSTVRCTAWRELEATVQELLNGIVYNNGAGCRLVAIRLLNGEGAVAVTGLSEKRHYRDKFGEHPAIILETITLVGV
jgi:hypothetical protein